MMISGTTLLLSAAPAFAAPPEPLDVEFLDYLAACEGKDDNWTVVADDRLRKKAKGKPAPKQPPVAESGKPQENRP